MTLINTHVLYKNVCRVEANFLLLDNKLPPLGQRWNINIQLAQRNASEESSPSMHACMAHATQDDKNTRPLRPPAYPDDAEYAVRIHHTLPPVSVCLSLVVKRTRTAGRRHRRHRGKALSESAEKYSSASATGRANRSRTASRGHCHDAEADWRGELRGTWARPAPAPLPDDRLAIL